MPRLAVADVARPVNMPRARPEDFGAGVGRAVTGLGRATVRTAEVLGAAADQQARYKATQYRATLLDDTRAILSDPNNLDQRDSLFEKARLARSREFLGGDHRTFEREARVIDAQLGGMLGHETRREGIAQGQAAVSDTLDALADEWARADGNDGEQVTIAQRAENAIESAFGSGLFDEDMRRDSKEQFVSRSRTATVTRLIREDPLSAAEMLKDPVQGMNERTRQELLTRSVNSYGQVLRQERQARLDAERALEAAEKERAEEAELALVELDAAGSLTEPEVMRVSELIGSERSRIWIDRARSGAGGSGGGGGGSSTDPVVYVRLTEAVANGIDVRVEARDAYIAGQLSKPAYDDLVDRDQAARFGSARKHIVTSLDLGQTIVQGPGGAGAVAAAKSREAQALREFDQWHDDNRAATPEEAFLKAESLVRRATIVDLSENSVFNLTPQLIRRTPDGRVDELGSLQAIGDAGLSEAQQDTEFAYLERLLELERISDAGGR